MELLHYTLCADDSYDDVYLIPVRVNRYAQVTTY